MVSTSGISLPAGALSPPGGALTLASGLCYPGEPGLVWGGAGYAAGLCQGAGRSTLPHL